MMCLRELLTLRGSQQCPHVMHKETVDSEKTSSMFMFVDCCVAGLRGPLATAS